MLFLAKRDAKFSLISAALLALAAYVAYAALDLVWRPPASGWHLVEDGLFGLAVILASDASLHTLFSSIAPGRYPPAFLALAEVFAGQTPWDWLAGGVTAGAEELLFRGVLVAGGIQFVGLSPIAAAALAALAFGLAASAADPPPMGFFDLGCLGGVLARASVSCQRFARTRHSGSWAARRAGFLVLPPEACSEPGDRLTFRQRLPWPPYPDPG